MKIIRNTIIAGLLLASSYIVNAQSKLDQAFQQLGQEFKNHGYVMKGKYGDGIDYRINLGSGNDTANFVPSAFGKKQNNPSMVFNTFYLMPKTAHNDSIKSIVDNIPKEKMFTIGFAPDSTIDVPVTYKTIDSIITGKTTGVNNAANLGNPSYFKLNQNYPNPFNPETNISFDVIENANVDVRVYDILGREVSTLFNSQLKPGTYNGVFNGNGLSSGIYNLVARVRLNDGTSYTQTKKMLLEK
jgi:hypothetical protein